jgi:hypothetical protein
MEQAAFHAFQSPKQNVMSPSANILILLAERRIASLSKSVMA